MSGAASRILRVAALDLKLRPRAWAFAEEHAEAILAHWRKRRAERPNLFDGRVLLMGSHEFVKRADGATILAGDYFETDFKAFLAWRDFGFPDRSVCNGFSMAALQSSDGAYLLGEMADHTANAGAIYFAAGTPDPSDVFGGRIDLYASVVRELAEETGLKVDDLDVAADWIVVDAPPRIACMKPVKAALDAALLKARIESYLAGEERPELKRMHIARSPADIDETRMAQFTVDFLRYAFGVLN
ncbi:MAG TPA: NUDIX hydrolase [Roseiarcus sp.]|nr:NUDIX hydrolase [Roseiarcus sp.]